MSSSSISRSGWFYFYNLEKRQPSKTHHQERQKSTTCTDQERFRLSYRLSTIKKPTQLAHNSQHSTTPSHFDALGIVRFSWGCKILI